MERKMVSLVLDVSGRFRDRQTGDMRSQGCESGDQ